MSHFSANIRQNFSTMDYRHTTTSAQLLTLFEICNLRMTTDLHGNNKSYYLEYNLFTKLRWCTTTSCRCTHPCTSPSSPSSLEPRYFSEQRQGLMLEYQAVYSVSRFCPIFTLKYSYQVITTTTTEDDIFNSSWWRLRWCYYWRLIDGRWWRDSLTPSH